MRDHDVAAYWDGFAEAYDAEPDHGLQAPQTREAWRALLTRHLPTEPADVADMACGTGSLTRLVAELGHRAVGIDVAQQMLARARVKTAGLPVEVRQGDVTVPDLPDASVDVVLARHILWTLPDPEAALVRWKALLRPGGRLLLVEGRWWSAGDEGFDDPERMPWAGGVRSADLCAAVRPIVGDDAAVTVAPLTDPALWGRTVTDERYLLVAQLPRREAAR